MIRVSRFPLAGGGRRLTSYRPYATNTAKPRSLRLFLKVTGALAVTGSVLYFTNDKFHDSSRHLALTSERVGVVTLATLRCFKIYNDVLSTTFDSTHDRNTALSEAHLKAANITLKALEKNGGIYIKLGQHVSALTYLLPYEWTNTMIPLQDRCPESSTEQIEAMFKADMGVSIDEMFSSFSREPVGVASLAQVHVATLRLLGEKVAVKIQHPSLAEFVPLDIYLTQTVFGLMNKVFPDYPLGWLGDELRDSITVELDFTNEAKNSQNTAEYFSHHEKETALRVPEIVSAKKRILIMEYVSGARLDDLQYIKSHGISPGEVSSCLSHLFNDMIFTPDVGLHCDPHGGNLAIRAVPKGESTNGHNFEIVLYDHGLYRYITLQMKRDYARLWLAILDGDVGNMRIYAEKIAGVNTERKFQIFAAAITGRDPESAMNYDISKVRTKGEIQNIQSKVFHEEGVLEDLMDILAKIPRNVLLILKTNDLTRNLDENLENPLGPERTFLILANYCARVAYAEDKERNSTLYSKYSLRWISHSLISWMLYQKRKSSLFVYDVVMLFKNLKHKFIS